MHIDSFYPEFDIAFVLDGTELAKMAAQPPLYQLFPLRPSAAQICMDALVSALWYRLFPDQYFGQNHRLDQIFSRLSHWPDLATLQLCPYYFDQVTNSLPTRDQVKHTWVPLLDLQYYFYIKSYSGGLGFNITKMTRTDILNVFLILILKLRTWSFSLRDSGPKFVHANLPYYWHTCAV